MSRNSTECMIGQIIAGSEGNQEIFHVRKETLEKSPVIKGWISDPDSMPESLRLNQSLYLRNCQPDVVRLVIRYLQKGDSFWEDFDIDGENSNAALRYDPVFYVRVYKLAVSLALDSLCLAAIHKIQTHKYNTEAFVKTVLEAEAAKLIDGPRFRDWIVNHVTQNIDKLRESNLLRNTIMEGGEKAWLIFSALMLSLSRFEANGDSTEKRGSTEETIFNSLPTPPPSSKRTSPPDSIFVKRNARHSPRSPTPLHSASSTHRAGVKKVKTEKRNLNPWVKDESE